MTFYNSQQPIKKRVLVVGAGLVGMCASLKLAQSGARVTLVDENKPATGASWAAAGMLAPAYEAAAEENVHKGLFDLCMAGADVWRDFAPWLQSYSDVSLDYFSLGSLACAVTTDEIERLEKLEKSCEARNVPVRRLGGEKARKIDPSISNELKHALLLPTDQQVDNWAVIGALVSALAESGVQIFPDTCVTHLNKKQNGWEVPTLGQFDTIIWTAGVDSSKPIRIDGKKRDLVPKNSIIPVKGQMLAVDPMPNAPEKVLRFGAGYIAPKSTRIVIGATSEWGVGNKEVIEADVSDLLATAAEICPVLGDAEIKLSWAGIRPGTKDHAPMIGWSHVDGIAVAAGHYRNGILLAPITANILTKLVLGQELTPLEESFSPARFKKSRILEALS